MCDERTNQDNERYLREHGLTRRQFGKSGAGLALALLLPPVANAREVTEDSVMVPTPDGMADCYFVRPAEGRHPAVIIWPDIVGIRDAFRAMGKRLAESGYSVLVVNPYYRTVRGAPVPEGSKFGDDGVREKIMPHAQTLSAETCVMDGKAFVAYLDDQPSVDTDRMIGTMGYCMTGSYTFRLAAAIPERIGAGASFHGGGLVTDRDDSPHLLIPDIKAGMLVAIAANDDERNPGAKIVLRDAFDVSGGRAEIEVYADTLHGWCPPDSAVYNEEKAERAWSRLLALFEKELA